MIRVKKKKVPTGPIIGILVSLLLILAILGGINQARISIAGTAKDRLYEAVKNTVVHAYAIEGQYPISIEYMEEKYGLTYDKNRFFIDYEMIANNILPDIFIVDNEEEVIEDGISQE